MTELSKENLIKEYWNNRAEEFKSSPAATTNDVCLRELEVAELIKAIRKLNLTPGSKILDVGCGDGFSTLRIAAHFPELNFTGMDYCDKMIANACSNIVTNYPNIRNVSFRVHSILEEVGTERYSVALSGRCLINLTSFSEQETALNNIASYLVDGGTYIGIENFIDENNNLNSLRGIFGLGAIPIRWHNLFFNEHQFRIAMTSKFYGVYIADFLSSYYVITRVIYSKICNLLNKEPNYLHWMHKLGMIIPSSGGYCPVRLITATRRAR